MRCVVGTFPQQGGRGYLISAISRNFRNSRHFEHFFGILPFSQNWQVPFENMYFSCRIGFYVCKIKNTPKHYFCASGNSFSGQNLAKDENLMHNSTGDSGVRQSLKKTLGPAANCLPRRTARRPTTPCPRLVDTTPCHATVFNTIRHGEMD